MDWTTSEFRTFPKEYKVILNKISKGLQKSMEGLDIILESLLKERDPHSKQFKRRANTIIRSISDLERDMDEGY